MKKKTQQTFDRLEKDKDATEKLSAMKTPAGKPLNSPRQELFCILYATPSEKETFANATQSYIKAGFKNSPGARHSACRLLTSDNVTNRVNEIKRLYNQKLEITEEYLREEFKEINRLSQIKQDYSSASRALENLGKHIGFYKTDNDQIAGTTEDSPKPEEAIKRSQEKIRLANAV